MKWMRRCFLLGSIICMLLVCGSGSIITAQNWSIEGEYFEGCTCNPGCPCLFGSEPTHNKTCKISGIFHIHKGIYGNCDLSGQTVIGITDLTAGPEENWLVFYVDEGASDEQKAALLSIFQEHVFGFANVPPERTIVKYLPIHIESSQWRKKATAAGHLTLDVEILHGKGDPQKPTQIINKNFSIWAKEFDLTLDMGKAIIHRFHEGNQKWNYDGRSGFATTFHFSSNE